jgi:hypothetical protein
MFDVGARPIASAKAERFYAYALKELAGLGVPFLLAGTYALSAYTGVTRATKDMDIVCKPEDCAAILAHFSAQGRKVEIEDPRWLAKVFDGDDFFDVIFASRLGAFPVTDQWFDRAPSVEVFGTAVRLVPPAELLWSKAFIQLRHRYDGADIVNLILKRNEDIDWRRLLACMDSSWEVLLMHLVSFRWVYPSERDRVPRWLMEELVGRLASQLDQPAPAERVCRGRMLSEVDYRTAITAWGFADACEAAIGPQGGAPDNGGGEK